MPLWIMIVQINEIAPLPPKWCALFVSTYYLEVCTEASVSLLEGEGRGRRVGEGALASNTGVTNRLVARAAWERRENCIVAHAAA